MNVFRKLAAGAAVGLAVLAAAAPIQAQDADKIVVISWGGPWGDAMREVLFAPFTAETGIEVELRTQGGMMDMLAQLVAQKDRLDADLWVTGMVPTMLARDEGLLADFPIEEMSNVASMPDELAGPNHVALWNIFYGLVYNSEAVPFEITSWEDLKDERLSQSISIPHGSGYGGKFILLQAWLGGGDEENIDPAFENLEALKPNVALVTTSDPDAIKFLTSGETDVATMMPVGNFLKIQESGDQYKFVAPEPYVPANFNNFTLLDGPNSEAAAEFVNFALSPERQTALSERLLVLPANPEAKVPAALEPYAPSPDQLRFGDEVAIGQVLADWASRWDAVLQN